MPPVAEQNLEEVKGRLREETPYWAEHFGKIVDKRGALIPCVFKPGQLEFDRRLEAQRAAGKPMRMMALKARQIGLCLDPGTRVLSADLRWLRIDDIEPGQEIVSVDENPPGGSGHHRRMRRAVVEAKREVQGPAFRLTMDNGETLIATGGHRFLSRRRGDKATAWRRVESMRVGDPIRRIAVPWKEPAYEDGWFGGLIDGEGSLRPKSRAGVELTISQRLNGVYARARTYLAMNRYTVREDIDHRSPDDSGKLGDSPVGRLVLHRMNELFRLIGQTRPERFIGLDWWEGKGLPGKRSGEAWSQIVRIESLAEQRMIDLQTSTKTFIAEGFVSHNSTATQTKLVHRCTLRERYDALTVAHDRETGAKLYRMAETLYANLPEDPELKPALGQHRRQRYLHFAGEGLWTRGQAFPDSRYLVDTAGEFQAGRGGTYRAIHGSEVGWWAQILLKLTALMAAVPDDPETLVVLESTANGFNEFKDLWDDAEEGRSEFDAFFWPWWKEEEYSRDFASETERESFLIGDPTNPYAEQEPELVKAHELSAEQLYWRRYVIANKCGGDVRIFHQEFPSTPTEAFIATGQKVFDPYRAAQLVVRVELTDPRQTSVESPGPRIGDFGAERVGVQTTRTGDSIEVPESALWTPREPGVVNPESPWRLWLPEEEMERRPSEYIVGVDVSGGRTETTREPDYHAIEVIDHKTREQVAEYRSRIDPDLLTKQVLLAALYFNNAWVAVERTGSWGQPILRILWLDMHYPFVYRSKRFGHTSEKTEHRLGWDTNVRTKPDLIAGMGALLRTEEDGIRSRALAGEVRTYTRTERGTTEAEPGRYDDLLMAYMIAQQVARELPLREEGDEAPDEGPFVVASQRLASYDPRYG